ncbi:hypothetical protein ACCO45_005086 [Purpureocillium lilacinum]|uniref:Uncharacterized protein n=1 Tax=Purpureocillium lilacinum TaxID=33203 RepID=A0ACC4DWN0_PURLI
MAPVTRRKNQAAKANDIDEAPPGEAPAARKRTRAAPKATKARKKPRAQEESSSDDEGRASSRSADKCIPAIEELPAEISAVIARPAGSVQNAGQYNETFIKARECLQSCAEMAKQYQEFNKRPTEIKMPEMGAWRQDIKDLKALNHRAMVVSIQALNSIVMAKAGTDVGRRGNDVEVIASELLEDAMPKNMEETWGGTARKLVKLLGSAVELLPTDCAE